MFGKKASNNPTENLGKTNRIVQGTEITGNVFSEADFRLDGTLLGNFTSNGKLVIGPQGKLIGDISCVHLDIEGIFEGNSTIKEQVSIRSTAIIKGNLTMNQLLVEAGAKFDATCQMTNQKNSEVEE